jgi:hypothetical protein
MSKFNYITPYNNHSEIHILDREYIETVSSSCVDDISIEEINEFLEFVAKCENESEESWT